MISWENYEEYMMMHADGELQPAEVQELMAFLDANPALKSEMAIYDLTRLTPDESLTYHDKNSLLKPEPVKRIISFPQWRKYAIAAGIALLVFVSLFKYSTTNKTNDHIAKIDTTKLIVPHPANNTPRKNEPQPQQEPQSIAATTVQPAKVTHPFHHDIHPQIAHNKKVANPNQHDNALVNNITPATKAIAEIEALSTINTKPLPSEIAMVSLPMATIPVYEITPPAKPTKRSLIDRLPIDEANKRQLKMIAHITSGASRSVNKVKEEIDGNAITFNINNNKVHISF